MVCLIQLGGGGGVYYETMIETKKRRCEVFFLKVGHLPMP